MSGCKEQTADGYKFETKQWTANTITVKVVEYQDRDLLVSDFNKQKGTASGTIIGDNELMAYSVIDRDATGNETCTMHVIDPAQGYEPEWIGHEFTHCIHGQWHPHQ